MMRKFPTCMSLVRALLKGRVAGACLSTTSPPARELQIDERHDNPESIDHERVRLTLADNPSIIIAHHPPQKIRYSLTRPVSPPNIAEELTPQQCETAVTLIKRDPLIWTTHDIALLFNVAPSSVVLALADKIPRDVTEKQEIARRVYDMWDDSDQAAFTSLKLKKQTDARIQLFSQSPELFENCSITKEDEYARRELLGTASRTLPHSPLLTDSEL